jgi:hypothetical protein
LKNAIPAFMVYILPYERLVNVTASVTNELVFIKEMLLFRLSSADKWVFQQAGKKGDVEAVI